MGIEDPRKGAVGRAGDDAPDPALDSALRSLRRDVAPSHDLWPGIAARLAPHAMAPADVARAIDLPRHRARPAWYRQSASLATAAALLLAVGIGWQGLRHDAPATTAPLLVTAADGLASEYSAAVRQVDATRRNTLAHADLQRLDQSAADVRRALQDDPDARFLLARLQSLYARRLALTQRLAAIG